MSFVLLHYVVIGHSAVMRREDPTLDRKLILASVGFGALAGALIGGSSIGSVRIHPAVAGTIRGILCGVAVIVFLGVTAASRAGPKVGEGVKYRYLIYGVPPGVLIGGIIGALIGWRKSSKALEYDSQSTDI